MQQNRTRACPAFVQPPTTPSSKTWPPVTPSLLALRCAAVPLLLSVDRQPWRRARPYMEKNWMKESGRKELGIASAQVQRYAVALRRLLRVSLPVHFSSKRRYKHQHSWTSRRPMSITNVHFNALASPRRRLLAAVPSPHRQCQPNSTRTLLQLRAEVRVVRISCYSCRDIFLAPVQHRGAFLP